MKTINHEGKIYQVGAVYEFTSDTGNLWSVDILEDICPASNYHYKTRSGINFKFIRACEENLGNVEESPVKLKNGECYSFTDLYGNERKGFFSARRGVFFRTEGCDTPSECTSIKLLVAGE